MKSKKISSAKLKRYSGVVIVTDHDKINYYSIISIYWVLISGSEDLTSNHGSTLT